MSSEATTMIKAAPGVQTTWLVGTHGEQIIQIEEPPMSSIVLVDGLQGVRHGSGTRVTGDGTRPPGRTAIGRRS